MGIMNLNLFRKAYMLEFLENDIPKEIFTFSIPPESEDFDFPQRITETKTFGGSAFDDYGNDTISITLTGTTVNEEKKLIYKGFSQPPKYLTGEKEIFYLQKILHEWGETEKLPAKKVYLYDLSKMSLIQLAEISGGGSPSRNYWRVAIKRLRIRRSKDKPLTFNYILEMTGFLDEKKAGKGLFSQGVNDVLNECQEILDGIQEIMGYVEFAAAAFDSTTEIAATKKAFEEIGKANRTTFRIITGDSNNSVYNTSKHFVSFVHNLASLVARPKEKQKEVMPFKYDALIITFDTGGGSYIAPAKVKYGNTLKPPIPPIMPGHSFLGWYADTAYTVEFDFTVEITKSVTLYAKWTHVSAKVIFDSNGGSFVTGQVVEIGGKVIYPPIPQRENYLFMCWCQEPNLSTEYDFNTIVNNNFTLYAKWAQITNTVRFESNGGSDVLSQSINIGQYAVKPPDPEREGYTFVRWCGDPALTNEFLFNITAVILPLVVYAEWSINSFTVSFESIGGSAVTPQSVDYNNRAVYPINPVKAGHLFRRWCTAETLETEFDFSTAIIENITLYAEWFEVNYD